jgi:hypothetical protein
MSQSGLWKSSQPMLTKWTEDWLGFTPTYDVLEHGHQKDAIVCGIATVNTMEHFLSEEVPVYSHDVRDELRLQYTLRLCELVADSVSTVPSTLQVYVTERMIRKMTPHPVSLSSGSRSRNPSGYVKI